MYHSEIDSESLQVKLKFKLEYRKAPLKFFIGQTTTTQQHYNRKPIVDQVLTYSFAIAINVKALEC